MLFGRRRGGPPAEAGPEQRIGTRFVMRQKMFSFGDDFTVTDEQGRKVFSVDGKMFRLRDTPLRDRFQIDLAGGGKLLAKGNFLYHEYRILRGDWPAAIISKQGPLTTTPRRFP